MIRVSLTLRSVGILGTHMCHALRTLRMNARD